MRHRGHRAGGRHPGRDGRRCPGPVENTLGWDPTGTLLYVASPSARERIAADLDSHRLGINASRAVDDPLSCCLDLPSGEMLDLRRHKV